MTSAKTFLIKKKFSFILILPTWTKCPAAFWVSSRNVKNEFTKRTVVICLSLRFFSATFSAISRLPRKQYLMSIQIVWNMFVTLPPADVFSCLALLTPPETAKTQQICTKQKQSASCPMLSVVHWGQIYYFFSFPKYMSPCSKQWNVWQFPTYLGEPLVKYIRKEICLGLTKRQAWEGIFLSSPLYHFEIKLQSRE